MRESAEDSSPNERRSALHAVRIGQEGGVFSMIIGVLCGLIVVGILVKEDLETRYHRG